MLCSKESFFVCVFFPPIWLQQWVTITCKARHVDSLLVPERQDASWLGLKMRRVKMFNLPDLIKHESFQEGKHVPHPPSPTFKNVSTDLHSKKATYIIELIFNDLCKASICPKLEKLCNEDQYRQNSPSFIWQNRTSKGNLFKHIYIKAVSSAYLSLASMRYNEGEVVET